MSTHGSSLSPWCLLSLLTPHAEKRLSQLQITKIFSYGKLVISLLIYDETSYYIVVVL